MSKIQCKMNHNKDWETCTLLLPPLPAGHTTSEDAVLHVVQVQRVRPHLVGVAAPELRHADGAAREGVHFGDGLDGQQVV